MGAWFYVPSESESWCKQANEWLEKYTFTMRVCDCQLGLFYQGIIYAYAPLSARGAVELCAHAAGMTQDRYRELPNIL